MYLHVVLVFKIGLKKQSNNQNKFQEFQCKYHIVTESKYVYHFAGLLDIY